MSQVGTSTIKNLLSILETIPKSKKIIVHSKLSFFEEKILNKNIQERLNKLRGYSRMILNKEVYYEIVNIKDNPEYFI